MVFARLSRIGYEREPSRMGHARQQHVERPLSYVEPAHGEVEVCRIGILRADRRLELAQEGPASAEKRVRQPDLLEPWLHVPCGFDAELEVADQVAHIALHELGCAARDPRQRGRI